MYAPLAYLCSHISDPMQALTEAQTQAWRDLQQRLRSHFGKIPDLQTILYLIGVQELGKGARPFSKEEKQDLMHIAICKLLSYGGYYELEGIDQDGWPHWRNVKPLPFFDLLSQETLLMIYAIEYFETEIGW
jgi:hypothetical protein